MSPDKTKFLLNNIIVPMKTKNTYGKFYRTDKLKYLG